MERLKAASLYIFYALLAYMPLHIFLSTWLGTTFGILEFAKVLKDVVLVVGFGLLVVCSLHGPWFKSFLRDRLLWLIGAYALLTLLLALIKPIDQDAEILAVVYNLRFFVMFIYAMLLTKFFVPDHLVRRSVQIVMGTGMVVLLFGILQYSILPNDALTHIGYSRANGVLPAFFIDDKPDLERSMSTLRDPNSFGSYIIIILSLALAYFLTLKNKDLKKSMAGFMGLSALALWFTFSRSAWIGAAAAVASIILLYAKSGRSFRAPRWVLPVVLSVLIASVVSLVVMRNSYFVQNVIFHADESTVLEDPNELRGRFWRESLEGVAQNPLGYGPGTAGLASIRNDKGGMLTENYYLQVLYEVGILGALLFLTILGWVLLRLFRNLPMPLTLALCGAFIGLAITNFLVHIWSNEAVAITFWGLAGLAVCQNSNSKKAAK